jgi:hypothetical protein
MQRNSIKKSVEILAEGKVIGPENAIYVVYEPESRYEKLFFPGTYDVFTARKIAVVEEDGHYFKIRAEYKSKDRLPNSDDSINFPPVHPFMPSVKPTELIVPINDYFIKLDMRALENKKCSLTLLDKRFKPTDSIPKEIKEKMKKIKNELLTRREEVFS